MATEYIDSKAAAALLGVSQGRIRQMVVAGELVTGEKFGKNNAITKRSVLKLKAKRDAKKNGS